MKLLVITNGFIGDILFASSIAKKAKLEHGISQVNYLIGLNQPKLLMLSDPWIDVVRVGTTDPYLRTYDFVAHMPLVDQAEPATIQFQRAAGIENPSVGYEIHTLPTYDVEAQEALRFRYGYGEKPTVAYSRNWHEKSFEFTPKEYVRGIDVPNLGYGGRKHDINRLLYELSKDFLLVPVGHEEGVKQTDERANDAGSYAYTASMIKACDFMIGPEGGLTNLAAGVGTTVIMTTDFIWQLYGPNGLFKQLDNPAMGPKTYFPNAPHVHLDPFLDTQGIIDAIKSNINRLTHS